MNNKLRYKNIYADAHEFDILKEETRLSLKSNKKLVSLLYQKGRDYPRSTERNSGIDVIIEMNSGASSVRAVKGLFITVSRFLNVEYIMKKEAEDLEKFLYSYSLMIEDLKSASYRNNVSISSLKSKEYEKVVFAGFKNQKIDDSNINSVHCLLELMGNHTISQSEEFSYLMSYHIKSMHKTITSSEMLCDLFTNALGLNIDEAFFDINNISSNKCILLGVKNKMPSRSNTAHKIHVATPKKSRLSNHYIERRKEIDQHDLSRQNRFNSLGFTDILSKSGVLYMYEKPGSKSSIILV